MLTAGQIVELAIEKPAAGGRMIARHEGQVVFVLGAIPGERVRARIDKAERQLAFATAIDVIEASSDRREPFVDPLCGGCLYAHVSYPGQLRIKASVIQDTFTRLGRIDLPPVEVAASPERDYRMRGRLHLDGSRAGFYREGTHTLCDAALTGQLRTEAVRSAVDAVKQLETDGAAVLSVQITENIPGDQRAFHIEFQPGCDPQDTSLLDIVGSQRLTGCSARTGSRSQRAGEPAVADSLNVLASGRAKQGTLARSAESFFQANRFLLPRLVERVLDAVSDGRVLDLYAGVGLFSVALASAGHEEVTAVEGDRSAGADLRTNASQFPGAIRTITGSVENYLRGAKRSAADTVIVDPPRTGISKIAMQAVAGLGAGKVIYVSCDPPTMARDARRLLDVGYQIESFAAFDLFPNTPHVESVGVFIRS